MVYLVCVCGSDISSSSWNKIFPKDRYNNNNNNNVVVALVLVAEN